jgi:hypothetical protein
MLNPLRSYASYTIALLLLLSLFPVRAVARFNTKATGQKAPHDPSRVLVLDGTSVHNVGELQMHLLNWGEWGSRPGTAEPYSLAPSAQWPAGSAVEYLFSAGLWVGAIKNGVPAVSTSTFDREFRPSRDARDIVYRASSGDPGGNRAPASDADDDRDGSIDEDPLDGYDNDGDGLIDEDFGAVSRLMMTCLYNDDESVSRQIYPEHNPLHLQVRQESYQWDNDRYDDFVAMEFHITNVGDDVLQDVYVGMFVDADAGPIILSRYWEDDLAARQRAGVICTDLGPVEIDVAYMYDADGDDGATPGHFGVMFIDHPVDAGGFTAPNRRGLATYTHYSGRQAYLLGGDPTNDFERYESMAQGTHSFDAESPRDYRFMVSAGPFLQLLPDSTLTLQMAFVIGGSKTELIANASSAAVAYKGFWYNLDGNSRTGVAGRETPVHGPSGGVMIDRCRRAIQEDPGCDVARRSAVFDEPTGAFGPGSVVWINNDCEEECRAKAACGYTEAEQELFRTGLNGRESRVSWVVAAAPPPPHVRVDDRSSGGVVLYWDNYSELIPDNISGRRDFEGYRVWRADDWTRPIGTSVITGPPTELWRTRFQADRVNNFGDNTGFGAINYVPLRHQFSKSVRDSLIQWMEDQLINSPNQEPPCPDSAMVEVCDTLKAIARWNLHLDGGRVYYRYVDSSVHLGAPYFYSVVAFDNEAGYSYVGQTGDPASNFVFVQPKSAAQPLGSYNENEIYVVPNPVSSSSMSAWSLSPTNDDPSGEKLEFRNLPQARGVIRIFTLAGDLVKALPFDGTAGNGTVTWDLISRNGQSIMSGVYLYAIEFDTSLDRVISKFTVIR